MSVANSTLLVIGYGSLLSGYGLLSERRNGASRLIALDAFPVRLHNARRGLAKPTGHGRYLAMDLEPIDPTAPIIASTMPLFGSTLPEAVNGNGNIAVAPPVNGNRNASSRHAGVTGIGALGLVFDRESAPLIARREEYDAEKLDELLDIADRAAMPIGDFLLAIARNAGFNLLAYRSALRQLLGYTSPGYIFHPLPLGDGRVAVVAIGSGYDGSGDPAVQSKRARFGMDRLLTLGEALAHPTFDMDPHGQVGYYLECLLGGYHGIDVSDLVIALCPKPDAADAEAVQPDLAGLFAVVTTGERERFQRATSLDEGRYASAFGGQPHPALDSLLGSEHASRSLKCQRP
ncbi:MAG TPA: hypothetical protein VHY56_13550 [Candidatus Binataceae bacterium]|nr:hypothetical protein [Candidatus Binataceae bacterium]